MLDTTKTAPRIRFSAMAPSFFSRLPAYTYAGLLLNLLAWASSWGRVGPWPYTFFPLWLGFIIVLDGVNVARHGSSLLTRSWQRFGALFLFSTPFWWLYEILNIRLNNWHYQFDHQYSWLAYHALSSLSFSTVLPVVFEMAELLSSFAWLRPISRSVAPGPHFSRRQALGCSGVGLLILAALLVFPRYTYPLVWLSLIFLLDPLCDLAGRKSAFSHLFARDWRFIVTLALAALCCGFFWEFWNYWALPKWQYTVPFIDGLPHLFEMPIPGYLGYLPFGVELFSTYQFALLVLRIPQRDDNLTL